MWPKKLFQKTKKHGGIIITATDTEVGKTCISKILLNYINKHSRSSSDPPKADRTEMTEVIYIKPFSAGGKTSSDLSYIYGKKLPEKYDLLVPNHTTLPMAPYSATLLGKKPPNIQKAYKAIKTLSKKYDYLIIEGIGGLLVPLTKNITFLDFIKKLPYPILLIGRPDLGTLNHSLLSKSTIVQTLHRNVSQHRNVSPPLFYLFNNYKSANRSPSVRASRERTEVIDTNRKILQSHFKNFLENNIRI
ncbi:dethiobiotin synthase [Candidatus Margulisiibacteriota bacterium]